METAFCTGQPESQAFTPIAEPSLISPEASEPRNQGRMHTIYCSHLWMLCLPQESSLTV